MPHSGNLDIFHYWVGPVPYFLVGTSKKTRPVNTARHLPYHKSPKLFLFFGIGQLTLQHPSGHLHADEGEDQVQVLTKCFGDHLQAEESEDQV